MTDQQAEGPQIDIGSIQASPEFYASLEGIPVSDIHVNRPLIRQMLAQAWDEGLAAGLAAATSVPHTGMTYRIPNNPHKPSAIPTSPAGGEDR